MGGSNILKAADDTTYALDVFPAYSFLVFVFL